MLTIVENAMDSWDIYDNILFLGIRHMCNMYVGDDIAKHYLYQCYHCGVKLIRMSVLNQTSNY